VEDVVGEVGVVFEAAQCTRGALGVRLPTRGAHAQQPVVPLPARVRARVAAEELLVAPARAFDCTDASSRGASTQAFGNGQTRPFLVRVYALASFAHTRNTRVRAGEGGTRLPTSVTLSTQTLSWESCLLQDAR